MKISQVLFLILLALYTSLSKAQTDFDGYEYQLIMPFSFNADPLSTTSLGKDFNLPEVDIFQDPFSKRPEINMVAAAQRKAYRAQQRQQQNFSFIDRQSAIFSRFKPKFDNTSTSLLSPSYHQQPIYSGLNRVRNSAYKDLGDQFGRISPFYQLSSYRRSSAPVFYFSR